MRGYVKSGSSWTDISVVECAETTSRPIVTTPETYRREHLGTGDWEAWGSELGPLQNAIEDWREQLSGIERPWLCWGVADRFCRIQQRLVLEFGWTPVVGRDPRGDAPTILPGAVRFDANRLLDLPTVWLHFTMEFVYAIAPRMACWHSDLLVSRHNMEHLVGVFEGLDDGETAAYRRRGWWLRQHQPCPGLACATTRGASRDQWEHGCGWWKWFRKHPNFRGPAPVPDRNWDTGHGIWYWQKHFGGGVRRVFPDESGHCRVPWAQWKGRLTKTETMTHCHNIDDVVRRLQISDLDE